MTKHTQTPWLTTLQKAFPLNIDTADTNCRTGNNEKRVLPISQLEIYYKTSVKYLAANPDSHFLQETPEW